jgi:hypothetical protein
MWEIMAKYLLRKVWFYCAKALLFGTTLPGSILPKILVIGDGATARRL